MRTVAFPGQHDNIVSMLSMRCYWFVRDTLYEASKIIVVMSSDKK